MAPRCGRRLRRVLDERRMTHFPEMMEERDVNRTQVEPLRGLAPQAQQQRQSEETKEERKSG
jgi:hypothetical protein